MLKKLSFLLLIISLLVLTGCQKKTTFQPSPQPTITIPHDWQTYTSPDQKLTLYYPSDWQMVLEIAKPELLTFSLQLEEETDYFQINFRAEPNPENLSSIDWAVHQVISEAREQSKQRYTPFTLGLYQGVTESGPVVPAGSGPMTAYIIAPGNNWAYEFTYTANAPGLHEKFLPTLQQIISLMKIQ